MDHAPDPLDKLLNVKEVCHALGRSRWTVWRWKTMGCPFLAGSTTLRAVLAWLTIMEERTPGERARARRTALERVRRERLPTDNTNKTDGEGSGDIGFR